MHGQDARITQLVCVQSNLNGVAVGTTLPRPGARARVTMQVGVTLHLRNRCQCLEKI
jgi:hypothetical protein